MSSSTLKDLIEPRNFLLAETDVPDVTETNVKIMVNENGLNFVWDNSGTLEESIDGKQESRMIIQRDMIEKIVIYPRSDIPSGDNSWNTNESVKPSVSKSKSSTFSTLNDE